MGQYKVHRRSLRKTEALPCEAKVLKLTLPGFRKCRRAKAEKPGTADFTWNRGVRGTAWLVGFPLANLEQLIEPKSS